MNKHYLSKKYFIKGLFLGVIEKLLPSNSNAEILVNNKYKLVKWIHKATQNNLTTVGIFSEKNKKIIIKYINFKLKNLIYEQLINEANILSSLGEINNKNKGSKIIFPKVIELKINKNSAYLATEFFDGEHLSNSGEDFKINKIKEILFEFKNITIELNKNKTNFPKRSSILILFTSNIYFFLVILKDRKNYKRYISLYFKFLRNYIYSDLFKNNYVIAHKDLHSKNIIIKNEKSVIIDPEVCVLADPETDLAHIIRFYSKEISSAKISILINELLKTNSEKNRLIALSIYYSIQMMAIRDIKDGDFLEAKEFLFKYFNKIIIGVEFNSKLKISDKIYLNTLSLINKVNNLTPKLKKPVILCYHSISEDGWKYSTNRQDLENQIKYLIKNYKIVSLEKLLISNNPNGLASITFDDGYKDFLIEALPILDKYKIKGTLFVLGDRINADRKALDNNKELLTIDEIKKIKKMGWEIGYHTNTHTSLNKLGKKELNHELISGKRNLEKKLGFKLRFLAYPMGEFSEKILDIVNNSDFDAAFTTKGGFFSYDEQKKFIVDRLCIDGNLNISQFKALLSFWGITFNKLYEDLIRIKVNFAKI